MRRFWTAGEDAVMRARYPDGPMPELVETLGRTVVSIYQRAATLGLRKSAAYLASPHACRLRRGDGIGASHRFCHGHVPANKGVRHPKGWAPGRMRDGQFKPGVRQGVAVKLWKPIGTERMSKDGYRERKVNDDLPLQARWRAVHLVMWEAAHGPLPKGHAIAFINRDKTDIRLENLECVSRAVLMTRNTVHNLPKPIAQAVQLLGALNRQIRRRTAREEPHRRSA